MQKIKVKPLKGDIIEVAVNDKETVWDLKVKVDRLQPDHAANYQKLLLKGKVLDNDSLVKDLGIKKKEFLVAMISKEPTSVCFHIITLLKIFYLTIIYIYRPKYPHLGSKHKRQRKQRLLPLLLR